VVAIPGGGASDARVLGRAKQIGDLVKRRGVSASRMLLRVASEDTTVNGPIVVSYDRLVVTVPECGIWDKESSHDDTNTMPSNFGCSIQRNIGLMIDNPQDLIEPRKTTATHDATRSSVVLKAYRAGEPTGAQRSRIESASTITAD
jgi:pilus assembly protein CpaD